MHFGEEEEEEEEEWRRSGGGWREGGRERGIGQILGKCGPTATRMCVNRPRFFTLLHTFRFCRKLALKTVAASA
jgi:hypothetical protein